MSKSAMKVFEKISVGVNTCSYFIKGQNFVLALRAALLVVSPWKHLETQYISMGTRQKQHFVLVGRGVTAET